MELLVTLAVSFLLAVNSAVLPWLLWNGTAEVG